VSTEGGLRFDHAAWPLVIATCPEAFSEDSVRSLTGGFEECHARRSPFGLVVDTRPTKQLPSAKWRRDLSTWLNDPKIRRNTQQYNVGCSIIFVSALVRGAYTAINWLWKPPSPQFAVDEMSEAVDWCCEALTKAGVPLGTRLTELRATLLSGAVPAVPDRG
jgi:hypothetical protein